MGEMPRKDYGANAIVPVNNEVVKQVNNLNTPYSIQQLGAERSGLYIPSDEISFATIVAGTRVLAGNKEGLVKSVTFSGVDPDQVLETVTIAYDKGGEEVLEVLTVAALKASGTYFFVKNTY